MKVTLFFICVVLLFNFTPGNTNSTGNQQETGETGETANSQQESQSPSSGVFRSFFTIGSILSKQNNEFSKADLFVGFEMNTHWRDYLPSEPGKGWSIVTYVGAQLTSIGSIEEDEPNSTQEEREQFIKSRKAATVQGGIYFPICIRKLDYLEKTNTLFLAPILKLGFHTYSERENSETTTHHEDNFFPFGSLGMRLGFFQMSDQNKKEAPILKTYMDITVGVSDNIGIIRNQSDPKYQVDPFDNTINLYIEGRLAIAKTSLILGFDAYLDLSKKDVPDDLRFFLGSRVDLEVILGWLMPGR
jgi:hypothetical protein